MDTPAAGQATLLQDNNIEMLSQLIGKIRSKDAVIGIVGLGYVGLPLVLRFSEMGFRVIGLDIAEDKIAMMMGGRSPIRHIGDERLSAAVNAGFEATSDFSSAGEADVLILCVPTPLNKYREPDLSFVINTVEGLLPHIRPGQMLSLESTTYPGTTVEELAPRIESRSLTIGEDYFLVYSPEREDPGNPDFTTHTIPKVCGGYTVPCLEAGAALYGAIIDRVVPVSSTQAAEMVKLLENIHRSVNIGLVNEMKIIADRMGLDIFEIIGAAATKPFGFTPYYPGPGIGGHCIPIDPFYLTWKAREFGLHTRFIELAGEVNAGMPQYVIDKTMRALNGAGKSIKDAKILVLGIAYKRDVDDMRESPSVFIMELLRDWGADIQYHDPNVPVFPKMREHKFDLASVDLTPETLSEFDAVLLLTDHSVFDYAMIREYSPILIDTRGKFRGDNAVIRA
ncbi:MAG: nucleotide sugar dehydrogenase [Sphingomonadaceae bacterium]